MTSKPGYQVITMHILNNISRSKGNQAMKFGHEKCNTRNTFLEKSKTKSGVKTIPRPFFKKSKLSISLESKNLYILFLL